MNTKTRQSLFVYMVMHFCIDFSCFYYLMGTFSEYGFVGLGTVQGFLLYNFIAFGLQFLIGFFYDGRTSYRSAGIIGTLLVMAGIALNWILPMIEGDPLVMETKVICQIPYPVWLAIILILLALGNAFFHVAGGMDSLVNSNGKIRRCGMFVATGALGVSMGTYVGKEELIEPEVLLGILLIGLACLWTYGDAFGTKQRLQQQKEKPRTINYLIVSAVICFGAIVVRAYVGALLTLPITTLFLVSACTCFGKAMGGFLADEFSGKLTGTISVLLSAICFYCFPVSKLFSILGVVLFNVAMPITLYTLYECFPRNPGFAFGLSTFALLIGTVLNGILVISKKQNELILVCTVMEALCIAISTPWHKKRIEAVKET